MTLSPEHQAQADLFFRHIEDHGRFNEAQLYRFVELRTGRMLNRSERLSLITYAVEKGAAREKGIYAVYAFPRKWVRRARGRSRKPGLGQLRLDGLEPVRRS